MRNDLYLSLSSLRAIDGDTAPDGTLAYLPGSRIKHWMLFGRDHSGARIGLDLGGKESMGIWSTVEGGLSTAIVVPDWRIEVDPASAIVTIYEQIPAGFAFQSGDQFGLVGVRKPSNRPVMMLATDGTAVENVSTEHRGGFAKWRIVTGPADRPIVLTDSVECRTTANNG